MRTRIIRKLSKSRAEGIKGQYEAMGWSVQMSQEPDGSYTITATKQ